MTQDNPYESSEVDPDQPSPKQSTASPFAPKNLLRLFVRPSQFFSSQLALGAPPNHLLVTWCAGMVYAADRLDKNIMRADFGRPRPGWDTIGPIVTESWLVYWSYIVASGVISGLLIWLIGGWWYRVRLSWAGAIDPDKREARLVYVYSSLVLTGPALLVKVIETMMFANYAETWASDNMWSAVILIFPFWACVVSYFGVREVFSVRKGTGLLWFVILPWLVYLFALGLIATLVTLAPDL